jgi:hypothetical protein
MTNTTDWLNANSNTSGATGVYFGTIGNVIKGRITKTPQAVNTQYGERLVVEIECTGGDCLVGTEGSEGPAKIGETYAIWLKAGAMARAVRDAIAAAGASGLAEGGILAVQYTGDGEKRPGKNPAKLYAAQYQAPVAAVALGESLI